MYSSTYLVCFRKPHVSHIFMLSFKAFVCMLLPPLYRNCLYRHTRYVQAIACAAAYESEWPLLIICPSSARYHWEHELLKWLDEESVTKKQIMVVCKSKQDLNRGVTKVVIMSYELVRVSDNSRWISVCILYRLDTAGDTLRCACRTCFSLLTYDIPGIILCGVGFFV